MSKTNYLYFITLTLLKSISSSIFWEKRVRFYVFNHGIYLKTKKTIKNYAR